MNQQLKLATAAVVCGLIGGYALAALSEADLERLNKDLTPTGATRAGNADNTIPEWKGGLTVPPAGWKPEQGYTDPFGDEKPLFAITGANADQYKDKLSPGLLALLKKYSDFRMPVYPSQRTVALPDTWSRPSILSASAITFAAAQSNTASGPSCWRCRARGYTPAGCWESSARCW